MNALFAPGHRVVAKTNAQGLEAGRCYSVIEPLLQPVETKTCPIFIVAYRITNWPEKMRREILVKAGILHLRATGM